MTRTPSSLRELKTRQDCSLATDVREHHDSGSDKVVRRMTPEGPDGDIRMKNKESACGMDRSVLLRT